MDEKSVKKWLTISALIAMVGLFIALTNSDKATVVKQEKEKPKKTIIFDGK